jgi:hypothetical protein
MPRKKNAAALALAEISRKKRMRTMTAAQRSEQGKKAVAERWRRYRLTTTEPNHERAL